MMCQCDNMIVLLCVCVVMQFFGDVVVCVCGCMIMFMCGDVDV